jgi:hypothetical protein
MKSCGITSARSEPRAVFSLGATFATICDASRQLTADRGDTTFSGSLRRIATRQNQTDGVGSPKGSVEHKGNVRRWCLFSPVGRGSCWSSGVRQIEAVVRHLFDAATFVKKTTSGASRSASENPLVHRGLFRGEPGCQDQDCPDRGPSEH